MEENKPHKIIIIGDGQHGLAEETLSLLRDNFGDEFTVITVSEAKGKGLATPLTINDGVLYMAAEPTTLTNCSKFKYTTYIPPLTKRKKSYEPEYAKFDKIRKKRRK